MNVDAAKWGDGFDNGFDLFVNVMAIVHRGRLQANGAGVTSCIVISC